MIPVPLGETALELEDTLFHWMEGWAKRTDYELPERPEWDGVYDVPDESKLEFSRSAPTQVLGVKVQAPEEYQPSVSDIQRQQDLLESLADIPDDEIPF